MRGHVSLALVLGLAVTAAGCGDDEKKSMCERACERSAAADCPNDDPVGVCVDECTADYAASVCQAEYRAFIDCVTTTATFSCDPDGFSEFSGCEAEAIAYYDCIP